MSEFLRAALGTAEGRRAVTVTPRTTSASTRRERPRKGIPLFIRGDQAYYWTREWQEAEAKADEELQRGEAQVFDNVEDAFRWLDGPED